jgi:MFS family permease
VACAAGLVSTYFVSRQPEPPFARAAGGASFRKLVQAPWRDRSFRSFIFTLTVWSIGINIAAPFYSAQALKNLHVSYQQLATLDMTTIAVTLLTQPFWGRWADRVGHRRTLMISMIGASPLALMWLIATPSSIWLIYLNNVLSGIFWPGVNLSLSNRLMERAPAAGRAGYLALYSAITGGLAFLASMFGGVIASGLEGHHFEFGPLGLNNYQVLFLMAGVIRISVALLRSRRV